MDDFDRKNAQWHPYWRNSQLVKGSNKSLFSSIYFHPEHGILAVVSNLSHKDVKNQIKNLIPTLFNDVPCGVGSEGKIK